MIADPDRLSISVVVDGSAVKGNVSISLGLIMTELVINALKHAFPEQRAGVIAIAYASEGSDWTLSVTDNGIGMPTGSEVPKAGLGSGIVEALARNLDSEIRLSDANPGTAVTITHRGAVDPHTNIPAVA